MVGGGGKKRKFLYGMPVWYGDGSITAGVKRAEVLGFDYVEISLDHPWPGAIRNAEVRNAIKKAESKGMRFAFHAPLAGICLAHPRPQLRKASVSVMKSCIDFACKFKPRLLYFNIHISTETSVTLELGTVIEDILESAVKSRDELTAYGRRKGVKVVFENTQEPLFGMPSQVNLVSSRGGAGLCFDAGHAAIISAELASAGLPVIDVSDWINAFRKRIKVCHLHDFNAKVGMDHLPPGEGSLDLRKTLRLLRNKTNARYVLIEVFRHKSMKPASNADLARSLKLVKTWV